MLVGKLVINSAAPEEALDHPSMLVKGGDRERRDQRVAFYRPEFDQQATASGRGFEGAIDAPEPAAGRGENVEALQHDIPVDENIELT